MTDGLQAMHRSNPVDPATLEPLVTTDRRHLLEMLEADDAETQHRFRASDREPRRSGRPRRSATRLGYAGALAAAAVAVVGLYVAWPDDPTVDPVNEGADGVDQPPTLVVEDLVDENAPEEGDTSGNRGSVAGERTVDVEESARADGASADEAPTGTDDPLGAAEPVDAADRVAEGSSGQDPPGDTPTPPAADAPFDASIDLLSLHYDHAHLDDGHAAMTARELAVWFDLDPHVVSGTYAAGYDGFVHDYQSVMRAAWDDRWLDGMADRPDAVSRTVARWLGVLDIGGRVWVAEGGVSDFTADVVREITRQRPGLDTVRAIRVVQHIERNEAESSPDNLSFLRANTTYERIDDGNTSNGTANFNQTSDRFVTAARAGAHRDRWAVAFEHLPATELDFSDTVAVLHILGVGLDEVADPDDFAERFIR